MQRPWGMCSQKKAAGLVQVPFPLQKCRAVLTATGVRSLADAGN